MAPNTEIVGAAYQNRTADPKLLALQTFNDVYNNKKSQVSPFVILAVRAVWCPVVLV